ncbi:phosphoribosyltransferase [Candidatus Magnetaquicoccus inordinatus]|uniref:phosphoribosyltransferase n=1 Tax=Candidatus Magnetaquicoccus inordinatus TaxID=2496818 RepID=UPI00102CCDA8|nr:phosphoribosyltransferase family protein [Candidatus Magnetaquicoccus inordinatus]
MSAPFDHLTVLIDSYHLKQGVKAIARQLRADLDQLPPEEQAVLVVVLKGGAVFGIDLLRSLQRSLPVVFIQRTQQLNQTLSQADQNLLHNRHLIVVDTLMDTGTTLQALCQELQTFAPISVRIAILLHKTVANAEPLAIHYLGYEVPDVRLFGYGLDEDEHYRGMSAIYTWWPQTPSPLPSESEKKGKKKRVSGCDNTACC